MTQTPMSKTLRYSGAIALVLLITLVGLVGVQALNAADTPARQAVPDANAAKIAALEKRVAQLETQLKALETKTKLIASDGVTGFAVNAPGTVSLKGSTTTVESLGTLNLKGSGTSVTCAGFTLNCNGRATVSANANLAFKSALVTINDGGKPAARQGDTVMISGPGTGQVAIGSPTVLIGN